MFPLPWLVISVIILLLSAALSVVVGPSLAYSVLETMITILTTTVASLLAIVFSVLFISAQLASQRYSPKFTTLFVNGAAIRLGFALALMSILFNLSILTFSRPMYDYLNNDLAFGHIWLLWGIGGLFVGMSVVFIIFLYPLIRSILVQSTPINLLTQFESEFTLTESQSKDVEQMSDHPLQPVYEFVRNAQQREEYNAAVSATETIFSICADHIENSAVVEDSELTRYYRIILSDYSLSIIDRADDLGLPDVISTTTAGLEKVAVRSLSTENKELFDEIFNTLHSALRDKTISDSTSQTIAECCGQLFSKAYLHPGTTVDYIPRMVELSSEAGDQAAVDRLTAYLKSATTAHNNYIQNNSISNSDINYESVLLNNEPIEPAWRRRDADTSLPLVQCTMLMMNITSAILDPSIERSPPGAIYETWEDAIATSRSCELEVHTEHLLRRYIELITYIELNYQTGLSVQTRIAGIISDDQLEGFTIAACDSILSDERSESEINELQFLEQDITETWGPVPMVELQGEVITKIEDLRSQIG